MGLSLKVDEVMPFVVETATDLGLTVIDWQTGEIHRPTRRATKRPWWRKALIGIVAWTILLAAGVLAVGVWANAALQPAAAAKVGYQLGTLAVDGWLVGAGLIVAVCYARKPRS